MRGLSQVEKGLYWGSFEVLCKGSVGVDAGFGVGSRDCWASGRNEKP